MNRLGDNVYEIVSMQASMSVYTSASIETNAYVFHSTWVPVANIIKELIGNTPKFIIQGLTE